MVGNAAGRYFTIRSVVYVVVTAGVKLGRIPPDLRSGTSYLRSTTSNNRSCTPLSRSVTFLLGSTTLHSLYFSIFFCTHDVLYKRSPLRSFCHLHLSMLVVDRCCKHQTLFKCHKSQTECLECSKTPGRSAVGNPTSALGSSGSSFGPSGLAPIRIHHLFLSNLTTG